MTEERRKITPGDLLYLEGFIADAQLELSKGLAFIDTACRAFPKLMTPHHEVMSVLVQKAREHLDMVRSMMVSIPESFEAASHRCHSGEPFEAGDLFTKEEKDGEQ